MIDSRRKQTVRNLVIFAIVSISIGWVGLWLNQVMVNEAPGQNLGMLLWLVVPALTGLLLPPWPAMGGPMPGCVRPEKEPGLVWFRPVDLSGLIALVIGLGYVIGAVSFAGLASWAWERSPDSSALRWWPASSRTSSRSSPGGAISTRGSIPWAGALGELRPLWASIWGAWHVPYWFGFLALADFRAYTSLNLAAFVPLALCCVYPGRLRLRRAAAGHRVGLADRCDAHRGQRHHPDPASGSSDRVQERAWRLRCSPPAWKVCSLWGCGPDRPRHLPQARGAGVKTSALDTPTWRVGRTCWASPICSNG